MKAIITTKYGSPDVLELRDIAKPIAKDNELLIKIHAATITTAETMMRTGYPLIGRLFMGLTKPKNPVSGTGFTGEIEAIGRKVKNFRIGDLVFGESLFHFGIHAEYVCIKEDGVIVFTEPDEFAINYLSKVFLNFNMDFTPVPVIHKTRANLIKTPITLFAGKNDILFPGNKMIKRASKIFPSLKSSKLFENVKHVLNKEQNELIEKVILENNEMPIIVENTK